MENQGKRLLLAVGIAFAIMMVWTLLFPPEQPPEKPADKPDATQSAADGDDTSRPAGDRPAGDAAEPTAEADKPRGEEKLTVLSFDEVRAGFSSWGGSLASWELMGEQFHVPTDPSQPEDLARLAGEKLYPFTVGFTEESTYQIPANAEWQAEKVSDREVTYTWASPDIKVVKRYRITPSDYLLQLSVEYEVLRGDTVKQALVVSLYSQQDPRTKQKGGWTTLPREWKAACYVDDELKTYSEKSLAERERGERGKVGWLGFTHSYFLMAAAPKTDREILDCRARAAGEEPGGMVVDLVYPTTSLDAGKAVRADLSAYLGPKYLDKLEQISAVVDYDTKFEESVDLGFFGFLAGPLLWILQAFHGLIGSWGIAIILLTMLVKLATLYWTHKSMKSMRAMSKLKPQLDKLRDKYKDDRQKQQVETMNLFKAHGVNPLAGCLPMLLQMPIWFALYRALSMAAELYQAEFLWFHDMTSPDPYFILPVFMTVTMLIQSRLTPTTATGFQQKLLSYGMPLMFGGFSIFFPAGLTLYISTNTVLTLLHHLYMKKTDPHTPPVESKGKDNNKPAGESPRASSSSDDDSDGTDSDGGSETAAKGQSQSKSRGKGKGSGQRSRRTTKKKKGSRSR